MALSQPSPEKHGNHSENDGHSRIPWEYPPEPDFVVLADPDGNEFCVVQTAFAQD